MLTKDFFNAWNESRTITFQIAETMKNDKNFKVDFKPHSDMNEYGAIASHLIKSTYYQFIHYLQKEIDIPKEYEVKVFTYDLFLKGLKDTDKLIQDLFTELTMDNLQKEAYLWEPTNKSYSIGWCVFNLINHERWHQAQLKMYLKIMGCNTDKIGH